MKTKIEAKLKIPAAENIQVKPYNKKSGLKKALIYSVENKNIIPGTIKIRSKARNY